MFGDKEVWYKRKSDCEDTWEVIVKNYISESFEVECGSRFWVEEKIKDAMYKRGINPKSYKFKREDCIW